MTAPLARGARIGILGGGKVGRMLAMAEIALARVTGSMAGE